MEVTGTHRVFGGTLQFIKHESQSTGTPMALSVFTPEGTGHFPALIWLSGLTCTANNFTEKAGAYKYASQHKMVIIAPDTSPRGEGVANDEAYDLGQGAGFYIDATQSPWAPHFKMESYITRDLMTLLKEFPIDKNRIGISGHSMGGHGALTLAMKYPDLYKSVSAFAPIVAPSQVPWGQKAFTAYLGSDETTWKNHDACALLKSGKAASFDDILIDQGLGDQFLENQLKPELFEAAAKSVGQKITLRRHEGYDHSYYFMQSFIEDHIAYHAARLK